MLNFAFAFKSCVLADRAPPYCLQKALSLCSDFFSVELLQTTFPRLKEKFWKWVKHYPPIKKIDLILKLGKQVSSGEHKQDTELCLP